MMSEGCDAHSPTSEPLPALKEAPPLSVPSSSISSDWDSSDSSFRPYQPRLGLPAGYHPQTPFPSQAEPWPSFLSRTETRTYPSLASLSSEGGFLSGGVASFALSDEGGLERPNSLRSPHSFHQYWQPRPAWGGACCGRSPGKAYRPNPIYLHPQLRPHPPLFPDGFGPSNPQCGIYGPVHSVPKSPGAALSLEQRKVFVTYEADSEEHRREVLSFAALLRHNGFYIHIDMFEQQYRGISKIDFMEQHISQKDCLIIIIISPKYHKTVTSAAVGTENDETLNTVYIHKQIQNEFIQNGCRNFRFVPILFPGAQKCHVPTWLQNTHIYSWPRDRDDILRRLMRVEKYAPPPIGELPTIVSIPI
ncbi:adapter protein CIKS [Denticeps clupeoides]|uniref:adapter protein CIKS n=1 Tax=Denticeps clupeoides TaxID=299321 RepID=UPI0010A3EA6E|nr:adapter protein CIKS-like [Denticeps clupeoides]